MTEIRNVLAILAYHSGAAPSFADFTDLMKGRRYSLERYWRDNAAGVISLARFDLAGPYEISPPGITLDDDGAPVPPHRRVTADLARAAAADAGVDLGRYDATVVVLSPAREHVLGAWVDYDVGASGDVCVVPVSATSTYVQHESGHVLGFEHSQGVLTTAGDQDGDKVAELFADYGDPYDIMSAESFAFAWPMMAVSGTPTATFPRSRLSGPMLARAELYLRKHEHMDAAGTVLHAVEGGTTSAEIFPAGTGGPGRPELLVYATSGGGEIYVEYRTPGPVEAGNWWDSGLVDDVQRAAPPGSNQTGNVAAALVVHHRKQNQDGRDAVWYAARIAFPDADLDATFVAPDGTFTVSVRDAQHPAGDSVSFTIRRGTSFAPSMEVAEQTATSVRILSTELRRHPRFPDDGPFTWEVRETVRRTTYTPGVRGVGVGWPQSITDHSNVLIQWVTAGGTELVDGGTGIAERLRWKRQLGTGVLEVWNDPADGTLSVPLTVRARDHSAGGVDAVVATTDVRYDVTGRSQGWGADYLTFLSRRLKDLVNRREGLSIDALIGRPGPVEIDELVRAHALLADGDPVVAREVAMEVLAVQAQMLSRTALDGDVVAHRLPRRLIVGRPH